LKSICSILTILFLSNLIFGQTTSIQDANLKQESDKHISLNNITAIELVSFNINLRDNKAVKIDWQTASEMNNDYFTIERSTNGIDWQELTKIDGAGNSSSL
jgi:hypothetical protein